MMTWQRSAFADLSVDDLYCVLQKRQEVFILEQTCFYQDFDGLDQGAHHLLGWHLVNGKRELGAYLRVLAPGAKYAEMSIGRVLTARAARGSGAGRALLTEGLAYADALHPGQRMRIGAQRYLEAFYAGFGFVTCSEPYDEDGIIHVDMLR